MGIDPDDSARYAALYRKHVRVIYNYAWRRVGDQAPDIVSETFLVAWRRMPDLPDAEQLPWLLGVARRVVANAVRARARDVRLDLDLRAALAAGVGVIEPDHAQVLCARDEVLTALAKLSPRDQEALQLVAWDGLEVRDAARVVGCSTTAFTVRLHRARRRLAQLLAASADDGSEDGSDAGSDDASDDGDGGLDDRRAANAVPAVDAVAAAQRREKS